MNSIMGLDFETYCALDINKVGLDRYVNHPTFRVLLASVCTGSMSGSTRTFEFDFVKRDLRAELDRLYQLLFGDLAVAIVAHNAEFEYCVLERLSEEFGFPHVGLTRFVDSAVIARVAGAESKLEAAARQLLDEDKVAAGSSLIKLFSVPSKQRLAEAESRDDLHFNAQVVEDNPVRWHEFQYYCNVDAKLSADLYFKHRHVLGPYEIENAQVTMSMNQRGWYVDMPVVKEMQVRADHNKAKELENFRRLHDPLGSLNLNSHPQLKAWCAARGVKAKSFDELNVEKMLKQIGAKLEDPYLDPAKREGYLEVFRLLVTKQILGGSSLSKLQKLQDMVGPGNRLRGQYLHAGAGQTLRASGRGVQMQNLKRLADQIDMLDLFDGEFEVDNGVLATNVRQVFRAEHPQGQLIVGDYSSVESRGLAYIAGADWKLQGFRDGLDMYKVQAAKIFNISYEAVGKAERQTGKVGELSCGYGAGPDAVKDFAEKMGTLLTEGESAKLVSDWRRANPEVVRLWGTLDEMLQLSIAGHKPVVSRTVGNGIVVEVSHIPTPLSLVGLDPRVQSIEVSLYSRTGDQILRRFFHGCYLRGRNVSYYRPTQSANGPAWKAFYIDPKTKQKKWYSVYGGKLSGILTQSMCRELFMHGLRRLHYSLRSFPNVMLVGQFHDEMVVEWWPSDDPGCLTLEQAEAHVQRSMTDAGPLSRFPLEADVKFDHRYTK